MTLALARRLRSLQRVPIQIGSTVVYVDLRDDDSHQLLRGTPWRAVPWEGDEQAVMRSIVRPGDVAFDIGAHIGLHTALLAALVGPSGVVHAFEPNPHRHDTLGETIRELTNTTLHTFALGSAERTATLFVPTKDESMSSLADWTEGRVGDITELTCAVRTLDGLVSEGKLPRPDFIKCDVEGAELQVFQGARNMLDRDDAPILMYEANRWTAQGFGQAVSASTEWLAALPHPSFRFFHVQPRGTLVEVPPSLHTRDDAFNIVASAPSRIDRLASLGIVAASAARSPSWS